MIRQQYQRLSRKHPFKAARQKADLSPTKKKRGAAERLTLEEELCFAWAPPTKKAAVPDA